MTRRRSSAVAALVLGLCAAAPVTHAAPSPSAAVVPAAVVPAAVVPAAVVPAAVGNGLVSTRTEPLQAGVLGVLKVGDSEPWVDTPVQAFAEWTDPVSGRGVMFVGGKFSHVQRGAGAPQEAQPYLAAFDRETGAWIDSFRPRLDGTVYELSVAGGKLFVGGQFAAVNGVSGTAGLAALDPATGAVVPGWRAGLRLTGSTQRPYVRGMDVEGSWLYIGGNFSRITGPDGVERRRGRLARVAIADGAVSGSFSPNMGGTITDLDATPTRVWLAGKFTTINGSTRSMAGAVDTASGALVPMQPTVQTYGHPDYLYRQGIVQVGDEVWVTGSQHSTQVYRASDFTLLRQWISDPWGDGQALAAAGGYVYGGSHANSNTQMYADARVWPQLTGWTERDPVRWIGVWNVAQRDFVGTWQPNASVGNGEGAWELLMDSRGCLWAGGDFNRGSFVNGVAMYAQGFVKFCGATDTTPPRTPQNLTAAVRPGGSVALGWTASTDNVGVAGYIVFRNGVERVRVTSPSAVVAGLGRGTHYLQVQAYDAAGNLSRRTPSAVVTIP